MFNAFPRALPKVVHAYAPNKLHKSLQLKLHIVIDCSQMTKVCVKRIKLSKLCNQCAI